MGRLEWHGRCILALVSSYLLGRRQCSPDWRRLSPHSRRPIASVFLLYPARKDYADALAYTWHHAVQWRPGLVGFIARAAATG